MGLSDKVTTLCCSMDNLPFEDEEYDVIWSEGAIYNIGFEKGLKDWKRFCFELEGGPVWQAKTTC